MFRSPALPTLLMLALTACGAARAPVPLVGASGDTAFGDVVMVPRGWGRALVPWNQPSVAGSGQAQASTVLTIRFVRVERGHVSGTLDPYAEPQTGERLFTTFTGELNGNTIAGTYTTRLPSGETQSGRWSVQRR